MPESLTFPIKNGLGVSNDRFGLNRFARFAGKEDLCFGDVSAELMAGFEAHLADAGLKPNTVSFYMRNLRAIYNRAVEKGLAEQNHPFRHVYTGVEQTAKRAVPVRVMNRIRQLDLSAWPSRELARDLFLFSFYTRGMSFVDMAFCGTGSWSIAGKRRRSNLASVGKIRCRASWPGMACRILRSCCRLSGTQGRKRGGSI